jgi:hypothetical protein
MKVRGGEAPKQQFTTSFQQAAEHFPSTSEYFRLIPHPCMSNIQTAHRTWCVGLPRSFGRVLSASGRSTAVHLQRSNRLKCGRRAADSVGRFAGFGPQLRALHVLHLGAVSRCIENPVLHRSPCVNTRPRSPFAPESCSSHRAPWQECDLRPHPSPNVPTTCEPRGQRGSVAPVRHRRMGGKPRESKARRVSMRDPSSPAVVSNFRIGPAPSSEGAASQLVDRVRRGTQEVAPDSWSCA